MTFDDFKKYFSDFQICYYHDDYDYSAIRLKNNAENIIYLKFNI